MKMWTYISIYAAQSVSRESDGRLTDKEREGPRGGWVALGSAQAVSCEPFNDVRFSCGCGFARPTHWQIIHRVFN
jgi:hypothetical protein